jgi:hypothetical protein
MLSGAGRSCAGLSSAENNTYDRRDEVTLSRSSKQKLGYKG